VGGKKTGARFNLQFNQKDPAHLQVAGLLNGQGHHGKAQYIVNAILHYESCGITPDAQRPARFDEKIIEVVVRRILRDMGESGADVSNGSVPAVQTEKEPQFTEEINFDEAMDALGQDGFDAVAGALDMFRKK